MRVYLLVIDTIKLHIIKFQFLICQRYIYFYIRYTYFISLSSKNSAYIVSYITLRKSVELIYNYVAEKIQLHYSSQANPKGTCEKKKWYFFWKLFSYRALLSSGVQVLGRIVLQSHR